MSKIVALVFACLFVFAVKGQGLSREDSVRLHAQQILDNKIQPSDDDLTFACLANLLSDSVSQRAYYFKVYVAIARKADGALSEGLCGYIKTYLELYPAEAVEDFKHLDKADQDRFLENVAYEFYASGDDYKDDIDDYFNIIAGHCTVCSIDNPTIVYIKRSLLEKARRMTGEDN